MDLKRQDSIKFKNSNQASTTRFLLKLNIKLLSKEKLETLKNILKYQ